MKHIVSTGLGLAALVASASPRRSPPRELSKPEKGAHHEKAHPPTDHWSHGLGRQLPAAEGRGLQGRMRLGVVRRDDLRLRLETSCLHWPLIHKCAFSHLGGVAIRYAPKASQHTAKHQHSAKTMTPEKQGG